MSHNYLFDTYAYVNKRLEELRLQSLDTSDDQRKRQSTAGRVEALSQFETFLSDNFDAKLPRRLARQRACNSG